MTWRSTIRRCCRTAPTRCPSRRPFAWCRPSSSTTRTAPGARARGSRPPESVRTAHIARPFPLRARAGKLRPWCGLPASAHERHRPAQHCLAPRLCHNALHCERILIASHRSVAPRSAAWRSALRSTQGGGLRTLGRRDEDVRVADAQRHVVEGRLRVLARRRQVLRSPPSRWLGALRRVPGRGDGQPAARAHLLSNGHAAVLRDLGCPGIVAEARRPRVHEDALAGHQGAQGELQARRRACTLAWASATTRRTRPSRSAEPG